MNTSKPFASKVVIVTGASAGIGRAAAIHFAEQGAHVVLSARRAEPGEETAHAVERTGSKGLFVQGDVSDEAHTKKLVEVAVREFGALNFAFNNAGIEGSAFVNTADYDVSLFDQVIAINLRGVFLCMKAQLPHLVNTRGAIVNMASIAGVRGGKVGAAYYASKHGVVGLTKAAALEYAHLGVRVNAVCPAVIRTEMTERLFFHDPELGKQITAAHPVGRVGRVEEVTALVLYLCSDQAAFITGQALSIDGGRTA